MGDEYIRKNDASNWLKQYGQDVLHGKYKFSLMYIWKNIMDLPAADVVQVVRCKDCIHNNDCDIQHSAQAGENFFCGFGETEKDVREDVYE